MHGERLARKRIHLRVDTGLLEGLGRPSHAGEQQTKPSVGVGVSGIELDRAPELRLRSAPIALPPERHRVRRVGIGGLVIERDRPLGGRLVSCR